MLIDRMPAKGPCRACSCTRRHLDIVMSGGGEGEEFALLTRAGQSEPE